MSSPSSSSSAPNEPSQPTSLFGQSLSNVFQFSGDASQNSTTSLPSDGHSPSPSTPSISETALARISLGSSPSPTAVSVSDNITPVPGTGAVTIVPYEEPCEYERRPFQTISAQPECSNYSLEELRLADYNQGIGCQRAEWVSQNLASGFSAALNGKALIPMSRRDPKHLKILRGASIEISVGLSSCLCSRPESCDCNESWFLPKALISQYSPFLRAACTRDFKERDQNLIELPEDDPAAFALFVEWMYYGEYTVLASSSTLSESLHNDTNMNAKCWVLGDKLLCTEFKNYAMGRLYMQHTARSTGRVVATYNVQYVCEHSATTSKLRQFYLDYVVEHFADPTRLKGTTEEWDELLIHHKDLRMLVFQSFKTAPDQRRFVQSEMNYMDQDELLSNTLDRLRIEGNDS